VYIDIDVDIYILHKRRTTMQTSNQSS